MYTQLNQYRKDNFKPILTGKFKKLAFAKNSITDKLFGDDLQKKIEDIQKSKNITVAGFSDNTTGNGPYNNKTTGNGPYNNKATGNGPYNNKTTGNGPCNNKPTGNGPYNNKTTGNGPYNNKITGNGPYNNKTTGNFCYNNRQSSETFGGNSKGDFKGRFLDQ